MERSFNSKTFVQTLADELVEGFAKANMATTPQLVGSSKERAVRKKLESLLPSIAGVGTGCVIDIEGNTSKQCDIIIYERYFCPVFSVNDNPETTYYPCESVIAVGEIKTSLNSEQLIDSFEKIKSVKELKRDMLPRNPLVSSTYEFRSYGSKMVISGSKEEEFNQEEKFTDQIYGFILAEDIPLKLDTFLEKYTRLVNATGAHLLPNLTMSIVNGLFLFLDKNKNQFPSTKIDATGIQNIKSPDGDFQYLLLRLADIIYNGRSTNLIPFSNYIHPTNSFHLNGPYKDL